MLPEPPGEVDVLEEVEVPVPVVVPGAVVVEDVLEEVLGCVLAELLGDVVDDDMLPLALTAGSQGIVLPGVVLGVGVAVCGTGEAV